MQYARNKYITYSNTRNIPFILRVVFSSDNIKNIPTLNIKKIFSDNYTRISPEKIVKDSKSNKCYIVFRKIIYPDTMYGFKNVDNCSIEQWKE